MEASSYWLQIFDDSLMDKTLWKIVCSNRKNQTLEKPYKIVVRPIQIKYELMYQTTFHYKDRVIHKNFTTTTIKKHIFEFLDGTYQQILMQTKNGQYYLIVTKTGMVFRKGSPIIEEPIQEHDRSKNHLLPDGILVKSLYYLGIMDENGHVNPTKRDKFSQINRFLESLSDLFSEPPKGKQVIVDFGCGKAYLTFALMEIMAQKNVEIELLGIDQKKDVMDNNNLLAKELGMSQVSFVTGNIVAPLPYAKVNIVLSLHACDSATDDAILQGLKYKADWILVAPCCQHEIFHQLKTPFLQPMLKYGILKERMSSILTDTIRASLLEVFGYQVHVIEFVDTQHTPKNIMIRAKRTTGSFNQVNYEKCLAWIHELGLNPYIHQKITKMM
jgi:hypothetical protein